MSQFSLRSEIPVGVYDEFAPLRRLWAAVLRQAIQDYACAKQGMASQFEEILHRDPVKWFESDSDEPQSFIWMCEVLNIDCRKVRQVVLADLLKFTSIKFDRRAA
jgi:hypothetical protein